MSKEELRKEAQESYIKLLRQINCKQDYNCETYNDGYIAGAEPREKRIAELEEKISILLSCKNCPDNKGGYICQKEYENKCLTQKIQYIKELKEENAELTDDKNKLLDVISNYEVKVDDLEQKNADLKEEIDEIAFARGELEQENESLENIKNIYIGDLLKAKGIIKDLLAFVYIHGNFSGAIFDKAMEFIKDDEVENDR